MLLVAVAGGIGAVARAEVGRWMTARGRPHRGTDLVNVAGAVALGLVVGLASRGVVSEATARIVGVGFLGGFTTFSTWMVQATTDTPVVAARRTAVLLAVGVAAAAVGRALAAAG